MQKITTISVDSEGTDQGYMSVTQGVLQFALENPNIRILLYVLEDNVNIVNQILNNNQQIKVVATKLAAMVDTDPKLLIINIQNNFREGKFDYSMTQAIYDCFTGASDSCFLPGHVGHILLIARAIERSMGVPSSPVQCLMTVIPTLNGLAPRVMLDLGGVINQDLLKLAIVGREFVSRCLGVPNPKVGFLNIGTESNKGRPDIRQAAQEYGKLFPSSLYGDNGFIEPNKILFDNDCNVVACDGFVGNCVLKASEGAMRFVYAKFKEEFTKSTFAKMMYGLVSNIFQRIKGSTNPDYLNAAIVVGFDKLIVKCHGGGTASAIQKGLSYAQSLIPHFPVFRQALKSIDWPNNDKGA